ncbi:Xaa-Pro dipeptidase [Sporothrix brasiliensis 5110]|uniref:Xaa-Pro aminopeptidase n=1 Tax=Sporothrix brasiliensis 5110 TaxID=1398154 RepID=A0A0C2IZY8_9PEZI|nr:Xaa-Pro dipeptidase [Sporothrix brasiliensis 5110]KIH90522.1 Xaa-Pro dipeptidase [Sporothrix brasiliensis 5110]
MQLPPPTAMTNTPAYESVLKGKYPAKAHAKRVAEYIRSKRPDNGDGAAQNGVLYLESRATKLLEDNDEPEPFRQRRPFYYLTGCPLADSYYVYDLATETSTLFIPPIDPEAVVWSGLPVSAEEALAQWDVDEVKYVADVNATLAAKAKGRAAGSKSVVFALDGQVSDQTTFLGFDATDFALLREAIDECRVVKSPYELALMAKANDVSSAGHRAVLAQVGKARNEQELEGVFLGHCVGHGCRNQAYHSIVASGRAAATLHYIHNDQPLANKLNLLLDAGAEYQCYAADITRTFPIAGRFSTESRAVYDIVLRMQLECIALLKEGVRWDDVHVHAHKVAIDGLLALGILKGDKDAILRDRTSVAFFPHGLGHYLGMDTHDTGGHANYADEDALFRYLRVRGTLPAGSVITVEPGIYFFEFMIRPFLKDPVHAKYIDEAVLDKYWDVGGVRIEDNLVITKTGSDNLTTAPKDPDELLAIINGAN